MTQLKKMVEKKVEKKKVEEIKYSEKTLKAVQAKLEEMRARGRLDKPPENEGKKAKRNRLLAERQFRKELKEHKKLADKVLGSYPSQFSIGKLTNDGGPPQPPENEPKRAYKLRPGLNQ